MKKYIVQLTLLTSIYFFLYSLYYVLRNQNIDNIILLICSIIYCYISYKINSYYDYFEEKKDIYYKVVNGKTLNSKTEKEKLNWYKIICEDIFNKK